jgi:hypothetical protein
VLGLEVRYEAGNRLEGLGADRASRHCLHKGRMLRVSFFSTI